MLSVPDTHTIMDKTQDTAVSRRRDVRTRTKKEGNTQHFYDAVTTAVYRKNNTGDSHAVSLHLGETSKQRGNSLSVFGKTTSSPIWLQATHGIDQWCAACCCC